MLISFGDIFWYIVLIVIMIGFETTGEVKRSRESSRLATIDVCFWVLGSHETKISLVSARIWLIPNNKYNTYRSRLIISGPMLIEHLSSWF